jgi:hypothetical protein
VIIVVRSHIVPKLIIERFAHPINVFDVQGGNLKKGKNPKKTFNVEDAYEDEVEKQLCQKIESPFAKLIDNKILNKCDIVLTREELMLMKRFMLVQSIRSAGADGFYENLSNFKVAVDAHIEMNRSNLDLQITKIPSITEKEDKKFTLYMQAMRMFSECIASEDMLEHEYVTRESYFWAKAFQDAYLVFWDSDEKQDFILSDNGTAMEYALSSMLIEGGYGFSKLAYLRSQREEQSYYTPMRVYYTDLFLKNQTMYENFSVFNLTSNRCVALVNPFFRLYSNKPV